MRGADSPWGNRKGTDLKKTNFKKKKEWAFKKFKKGRGGGGLFWDCEVF